MSDSQDILHGLPENLQVQLREISRSNPVVYQVLVSGKAAGLPLEVTLANLVIRLVGANEALTKAAVDAAMARPPQQVYFGERKAP